MNNILRFALITIGILLIPLVAMQFTDQVVWTLSDFVFAGCVLFGTGLIYEFGSRRIKKKSHKMFFGIALLLALIAFWIESATGIL